MSPASHVIDGRLESQKAKGANTLKRNDFTRHTQFANLTGNILTHQIMGLVIGCI